jgi:hypothetical protein
MREELKEGGASGAVPWETTRAKLQSAAALTPRSSHVALQRERGVRREGAPEYAAEAVHDEDVVLVPAAAALRMKAAQGMRATRVRLQ